MTPRAAPVTHPSARSALYGNRLPRTLAVGQGGLLATAAELDRGRSEAHVPELLLADPPLPSFQDYYAAALALFGIILFAKFASHNTADFPRGRAAWTFHILCVFSAATGGLLCFL